MIGMNMTSTTPKIKIIKKKNSELQREIIIDYGSKYGIIMIHTFKDFSVTSHKKG